MAKWSLNGFAISVVLSLTMLPLTLKCPGKFEHFAELILRMIMHKEVISRYRETLTLFFFPFIFGYLHTKVVKNYTVKFATIMRLKTLN